MTGRIIGTGSYVPERIVTNEELAGVVETSDEWIVTRTGIHERRIAETEGTSVLAASFFGATWLQPDVDVFCQRDAPAHRLTGSVLHLPFVKNRQLSACGISPAQ